MPPARRSAAVDERNSKRPPALGTTVKVRALQRGQYGRPTANLVEPGAVFAMAVADLEPVEATLAAVKGLKDEPHRKAREQHLEARQQVTVGATAYFLPSWVEDAKTPVGVEEEDLPDTPSISDDVL